jgi:hypothetical protein
VAGSLAVTRGTDAGLRWEYAVRPVDGRLAGLVDGLAGYAEHSDRPVVRRQPPVGALAVIVNLGPRLTVDGEWHSSFAAGLYDTAAVTGFTGAQAGVEFRLSPLGAYRLLGVPPGEFTNRAVDLPVLAELAERVADSRGWAGRLDAVEAVLLRRAAGGRDDGRDRPDPAVAWAWRVLWRTGGTSRRGSAARSASLRRPRRRCCGSRARCGGWSGASRPRRWRPGAGTPTRVTWSGSSARWPAAPRPGTWRSGTVGRSHSSKTGRRPEA